MNVEKRTKIIVDGSKEYQENENKYFTKELERIDLINDTDILTNIETYSSIEDTTNNATENTNPYNVNSVWGNSDSEQIVINLNLNNVGYGFNNYWNFYDPYNTYGYLNPWNRRAWRFGWRGRFGDPSFCQVMDISNFHISILFSTVFMDMVILIQEIIMDMVS